MSSGGSGSGDYRNEVQQSLQGANLPKSALSQQYNAYAQNVAPSIFQSLLNAQNMGNSAFGGQIGPSRQLSLSQGPWADKSYDFQSSQQQQQQHNEPWSPNNPNGTWNHPGAPPISGNPGTFSGPGAPPFPSLQQGGGDLGTNHTQMQALIQAGISPDMAYNLSTRTAENTQQNFSTLTSGGIGFGQGNPLQNHPLNQDPRAAFADLLRNKAGGNFENASWGDIDALGGQGYDRNNIASLIRGQPNSNWENASWDDIGKAMGWPSQNAGTGDAGTFGPGGFTLGGGNQNPTLPPVNQGTWGNPTPNGVNRPQFQQSNNQFQQNPQALMQLMQGVQSPGVNMFNPFQGANFGQANVGGVDGLSQALQGILGSAGQNPAQNLTNFSAASPNLSGLQGNINPQDSQYYQSIADVLGRKQQRDIAETRARFQGTGTSQGTPAMQAEALLRSEQLPQLAQALGGVRQQEFGNELARRGQVQQGMLSQADSLNNATLGGRGQDLQAMLGGGNLNAQNLQSLLGGATTLRGQDIGNHYNSQNNVLDALKNLGGLNLGQQQLGSQNYLQSQGLQNDRSLGLMNSTNQFQQNQNQNNQFNAGQFNSQQNMIAQLQQQAVESQIQRQFTGLQNLLQGGLGLAMQGTPGGSANVNLSTGPQNGGGFGSNMGGIASLIAALGSL